VSECAKQLQTEGQADVALVEVTSEGVVLASSVEKALQAGGTALVTVMHSSNEVSKAAVCITVVLWTTECP
jgi:cysteine sulfinate desulfinase/cysteine desulfurase-like protein